MPTRLIVAYLLIALLAAALALGIAWLATRRGRDQRLQRRRDVAQRERSRARHDAALGPDPS